MYSGFLLLKEKPTTRMVHTPAWRGQLDFPRADWDHSWVERSRSWASSLIGGCWASTNLAGRGTDQYRGGSWASPGSAVTDRGPSLGPTSPYVHPRSTKSRAYGWKSVTRGALHPHKVQSIPPLTSHNKLGSKTT